jgi:hypothetical protein
MNDARSSTSSKQAHDIGPERYLGLRQRIRRVFTPAWLGTIRRTTPLSEHWGHDRGTPVDRYYIDRFLETNRHYIHGHTLEVMDNRYTSRYGVGVQRCDVLDIDSNNPAATIIADLAAADSIDSKQFDCFVLTQTLQLIYDTRASIAHAYRILRPGGTLLVTVPAVSKLARPMDYWRFTVASCALLFGDIFGSEQISVRSHGNVLTAVAFLTGMAYQELSPDELETNDERFPLIITVRAFKK